MWLQVGVALGTKSTTMKQMLRAALQLAVVFLGVAARSQTPVSPAFAAVLQQKLDSCVNAYDVPGISATLLLPGGRFWNGAAGVANIYTQEPMDTALLFQQASVTKLFTSTLIMQLMEEGELELDDTVGAFLPTILHVPSNTRIRHLLKHRSGLADLVADPNAANSWLLNPNYIWDPQDAIETFGDDPLFAQDAAFTYSNTNYVLLGMIIEQITGVPYAEALRTRILEPLGMDQTFFRPTEALGGPLVPGWSSLSAANTYTDDMTYFLGPSFASMVFAAGALVSRPWDVARFNRGLFSGGLLEPATRDTMRVSTNVNMGGGATGYGFGTMRYVFAGRTYFGHGGDINGFTQLSIHNEMDSVTLTLSINRNNAPRGPIASALLDIVFLQLQVGLLDHADLDGAFDLFPVPAKDHVVLRISPAAGSQRIEMMDLNGRVLISGPASGVDQCTIDLRPYPSGTYLVRLITENGVRTRKLMVQ